jgi:5-methylcytosine-specific restriction protein A
MTINPIMTRERVVIPPRKPLSKAEKVACWNASNGLCGLCGKPVPLDGPEVDYDHEIPRALTGDDSWQGQRPTHFRCHDVKTATQDIPRIAKAKRQEKLTRAKVHKAGGFTAWRKFNGEIVRRERK